jgi:two-component system phosphate regulon sensor histidine kinase PhoR
VVRNPQFVRYARSGNRLEPLEFSPFLDHEKTYEARRIETEHARAILLVRDVTELNRFLTMRQNFIANVSHELRTPLTVISGYLEAIIDEEKDTNLRLDLVSRLTAPTDRMKDLVSDLTTLTRLESAPLPDDRAPLDLEQLARAAAAELQPLCTRDDQITVASEGDTLILGIPSELHSICVNLISNALKYSPDGAPINITIKPVGDKVRLTVADQGYGIAPEHLGRLTERFYRVDLRTSRRRGGTGLGLAIVKHALMRHESELQISSTLGEGSTFACDFVRAESLPYA